MIAQHRWFLHSVLPFVPCPNAHWCAPAMRFPLAIPGGWRLRNGGWCRVVLTVSLLMVAQCSPNVPPPSAVTFTIDPELTSQTVPATVVSAGEERPVGLLKGPDGITEGFVLDEVMIRAETQEELDAFLARYNGTVLKGGSASLLPPDLALRNVPRTNWYLVRVAPSTSSLNDLATNLEAGGVIGNVTFSSEDAARLAAIVAREAPQGAWANLLMYSTSSLEHPDYSGGHLDAELWPWMTEDDKPYTPGDQGLSVGVIHAWDYMIYKAVPPVAIGQGTIEFTPTRVALVDNGFALSETTGRPFLDNVDYYNTTNAPLQWDEQNDDRFAGGSSSVPIDGGGTSAWHGQEAFGVCCAAERNQYGGAGTGGPVAQPILIKVGRTIYSTADAIYTAANMGADVINISMGGECGILCRASDSFWDNRISDSVIAATDVGAIVIAGAGNNGRDLDDDFTYIPCEVWKVICVGSIRPVNAISNDTVTRHNYGTNVAISAPESGEPSEMKGIFSTVTPSAVEADPDDFANATANFFTEDELGVFNGTKLRHAFTSGVVALMKAADPTLNWEQVRDILQSTANPSTDSRVPNGYVDAYRAVVASLPPNQPPSIQMTQPVNGQTLGWAATPLIRTVYADPEVDPTNLTLLQRFPGTVVISSSIDGELCRATAPPYDCTSTKPELTIDQHVITATATDPFGATSTHKIKVNVVNRPPEPDILKPLTTDTLYSHIPVKFEAFVPDPDELILDENVSWSSSVDDSLGTGRELLKNLTAGSHTITLTAVDGKGLSATDQLIVTVVAGAGFPTPVITMPINGELVGPGQPITLQGTATDLENGTLSGASLEWSSNIDGVLGTGNSIQVTLSYIPNPNPGPCLGGGEHTITLKATDSDGHVTTVSIIVRLGCII